MEQTTHTKGPLEFQVLGTDGSQALIVEEDGTTVAYLSASQNSTAHASLEANVRLFAMANVLLDELTSLEKAIREAKLSDAADLLVHAKKARAAIGRALGPQKSEATPTQDELLRNSM
ncbi:MAG: hypothetical protein EPN79_11845 [Burkholderiaceae bacterium]|nr:MAG: hypothetical protein EPN79_11845 [Burkholderiaceae bacterium]TBR76651.1 MAG: hypothetical protein EPN64_05220 [Burkholderiaceae bacterium]